MKRAYISGKISGLPIEEVRAKFQAAEDQLTKAGFEPVNPTKNGLPVESSWEEHMKKDLSLLLTCDLLIMLPCSGDSKGSALEAFVAGNVGIQIIVLTSEFKYK